MRIKAPGFNSHPVVRQEYLQPFDYFPQLVYLYDTARQEILYLNTSITRFCRDRQIDIHCFAELVRSLDHTTPAVHELPFPGDPRLLLCGQEHPYLHDEHLVIGIFETRIRECPADRLSFGMQELAGEAGGTRQAQQQINELLQQTQRLNDNLITHEQQLKESLQEINDLKFAVDQFTLVSIADTEGKICYVNDKFCEVSGYSREELIGRQHNIVNSGHHPAVFFAEMWHTIRKGQVWRGEIRNRTKNGNFYWVDTTIVPMTNKNGEIFQYIGIRYDVTSHKEAQEQLIASKNNLRALLDSMAQAYYLLDGTGKIISFSQQAARHIKTVWQKDLAVGDSYRSYIVEEDLADFEYYFRQALKGHTTVREKCWQFNKLKLYFEIKYIPAFNKDNEIFAVTLSMLNITEQKNAQRNLRESEQLYRLLAENTHDLVILHESNGSAIYISPSIEGLLGYLPEEGIGQLPFAIIHEADRDEVKMEFAHMMRKGKLPTTICYRVRRKDGSFLWFETHAQPILNTDGEVARLLTSSRDVTERVKAEEALKNSLTQRNVLLQEVYHRVKNNLAMIESLIFLQKRLIPDEQYRGVFDDCEKRIHSMALVHTHLYQSDNLDTIDIHNYILHLVEHIRYSFSTDANIDLQLNIGEIYFDLDKSIKIGLIINELVVNIFKYAFKGRKSGVVRVDFRQEGSKFLLEVRDNGNGFSNLKRVITGRTLGMNLVDMLSKDLNGSMEFSNDNGARIVIRFTDTEEDFTR